jgi:hypothetical protein
MNNKFDELTKQMARSVTRRAALKKFGFGLAGMALAFFGLTHKARATAIDGYCQIQVPLFGPGGKGHKNNWQATGWCVGVDPATGLCTFADAAVIGPRCPTGLVTLRDKEVSTLCGVAIFKALPCSIAS